MNPKRAEWEKRYRAAKEASAPVQSCPVCLGVGSKASMHPHHPRGRHGENILNFFYCCPHCHAWIHRNVEEATKRGWMIPNR